MGVKFSSGMLKQQPNKIIHVLMVEQHNFLFKLFIISCYKLLNISCLEREFNYFVNMADWIQMIRFFYRENKPTRQVQFLISLVNNVNDIEKQMWNPFTSHLNNPSNLLRHFKLTNLEEWEGGSRIRKLNITSILNSDLNLHGFEWLDVCKSLLNKQHRGTIIVHGSKCSWISRVTLTNECGSQRMFNKVINYLTL